MELNLTIGMGRDIRNAVISVPDRIYERLDISDTTIIPYFNTVFSNSSEMNKSSTESSKEKSSWMKKLVSPFNNLSIYSILFLLWLVTTLTVSIFLIRLIIRINSLLKECQTIDNPKLIDLIVRLRNKLGIRHNIEIRYLDSDKCNSPAVIGFLRPTLYFPRSIIYRWRIEDIEPILLHELAHIKRNDILINWLQILLQVVYFFNPLVWYVNWKIRQLREDACDDMAIAGIRFRRKQYSEKMLRMVKEYGQKPTFAFLVAGFTETKSSTAKRIKRILSNKYRNHPRLTAFSIVFLVIMALVSISLASGRSGKVREFVSSDEKEVHMVKFQEGNTLEEIIAILKTEGKPGMLYFTGKT